MVERARSQTGRVVAPADLRHELESRLAQPVPTLKRGGAVGAAGWAWSGR